MRFLVSLICISLVLATSCKDKSSESTDDKARPAASKAAEAPSTTESSAKSVPIADEKLKALLAAWLDAQNKGDYAAYEKLYAAKFNGVKRVGPKTYRYARKGWLADRKRMFRKPMTVEARDPTFNASPQVAQLHFTQRWASGKFEDLGPKRLLVVREGGELKIAQEEMLRSELVSSERDAAAGGDFYFLLDGDLVLHDAKIPQAHGPPKLTVGDPMVSEASIKDGDLDGDTLAWKGVKVRIDGECEATITGFRLVSRVVPHFSTLSVWDCRYQGDDCKPATDKQRAAEMFDMGIVLVVASLEGCKGGLYARRSTQPKMVVGEATSDQDVADRAIAAFGRLKG